MEEETEEAEEGRGVDIEVEICILGLGMRSICLSGWAEEPEVAEEGVEVVDLPVVGALLCE